MKAYFEQLDISMKKARICTSEVIEKTYKVEIHTSQKANKEQLIMK